MNRTIPLRLASLLALVAHAAAASAQSAPPSGWSLDRFEPAPAGDRFAFTQHPTYGGGRVSPRFGLAVDYAHNPLLLRDTTQGTTAAIVRGMLVGHVQAGVAFADRFHVHVSLPVSLYQGGPSPNLTGVAAAGSPALGDVRFGARVRVFGHADTEAFSVHVGGEVFLPATLYGAAPTDNVTDGNIRGRAWAAVAGRVGPFRWSATGGYHARPEVVTFASTGVGGEVFAAAGASLAFAGGRLAVGPEAWAAVPVGAIPAGVASELVVGARYQLTDALSVNAGAGPGLTAGLGTPTFRALAGVAWAPESPRAAVAPEGPRDGDRDGVADADDLCAGVAAGAHPDGARPGCPMTDGDGDGVVDPEDHCGDLAAGPTPDPARAGCPAETPAPVEPAVATEPAATTEPAPEGAPAEPAPEAPAPAPEAAEPAPAPAPAAPVRRHHRRHRAPEAPAPHAPVAAPPVPAPHAAAAPPASAPVSHAPPPPPGPRLEYVRGH